MIDKLTEELKNNYNKLLKGLQEQFNQILIGKITPDTVKHIKIKFEDEYFNLIKFARIEVLDQFTLKLILHDSKTCSAIIDGLIKSELGLSIDTQSSTQVLIKAPIVTEDYKKQLQKACKNFGNHAILTLQELRNNIIDKITKKKVIELTSDDMRHRAKNNIEDHIKNFKKQLEQIIDKKCKELQ